MEQQHTPPQDWKEYRRLRAWDLAQQGWKQCQIARALGVTEGAISRWLKRARTAGREALRRHPPPGPQPKLTDAQRAQLPELLAKGAEAFGFRGDVWTTKRVATMIARTFSVHYHPAHVSRILRALDWRAQQPVVRASQRDETAIEHWATERWPALKKGRNETAAPSSGSTKLASTCCPAGCGAMPRGATPRSSASR